MPMPTQTIKQREQQHSPQLTRALDVLPSTINEDDRTIEVMWSTGADVVRMDWLTGERYVERLSMDPKHVRLGRLQSGAPVLDAHRAYGGVRSVLGVVESAEVRSSQGHGKLRFSEREDVEPVWQDVRTKIIRKVSVGYMVHQWRITKATKNSLEIRTAVDWEPYEISMVPIAAEDGAETRSYEGDDDMGAKAKPENGERGAEAGDETTPPASHADDNYAEHGDRGQPDPAPAPPAQGARHPQDNQERSAEQVVRAERERVAEIERLCGKCGIDDEQRRAWVANGASLQSVRDALLETMAERSAAAPVSSVAPGDGRREQEMARDASAALLRRAGEKVEGDGHRQFGDAHLMDMGRDFLEAHGVNTRGMPRLELARRALATSDFSGALYLTSEKTMRAGYDSVPLVHRQVLRRTSASDFRPKHTVGVDAGDLLEKVPEGGKIPQKGARFEVGQYAIDSYGKIVSFTRKLMIDDDIDALTEVSRSRGRSAAETERKVVWDFILGNPDAPDGNSVFDNTNHNNYPAASGTPIGAAALDAAYSYFRTAKSLSGFPINAEMRYIIASDAAERALYRELYGMYMPDSSATGITERDRRLTVLCEPRISASNKKHWMGFADPAQASAFEFAYLAGTSDGVRLEQQEGFEVEGIALKVMLDFGIGCSDWRGVYYQRES